MMCEIHHLEMDFTDKKVCPLCELNKRASITSSDDVQEIVAKVRELELREFPNYVLTADEAAVLIAAHVAKAAH